jgi:hypothetical protein
LTISLQWDGEVVQQHREAINTANNLYDFLSQALHRVFPTAVSSHPAEGALLAPLAVGGAMAVYKVTILFSRQPPQYLVCKIPHDRRIVYASGTEHHTAVDETSELLERLATLAEYLARHAPGLFPRCGGVWHWCRADGMPQHLLAEEFIPGLSVERLKHQYEQQLLAGQLDAATYQQRRITLERLAVTTFIRLWDCLGRQTFTSDPSPWNILVQQCPPDDTEVPVATIIDLHSLEDHADLAYVVQRLAAVYGLRQEILDHVLLPGILQALGIQEGRALLLAELPRLEAEARQTRQNLGVDLQQPLLTAIRRLGMGET